jgi:ribosome maturation factor RimP
VFLKRKFCTAVKKEQRHKKHPKPVDHPRERTHDQKVIAQVWSLAEPVCAAEGLELIQVEYQREAAGRILRIYLDKPGGIRLEDCVEVSRQLGDILDVNLADAGPYNLEVTSPGPQRPIARMRDFDKYKGRRIKIKTNKALNGRKNFTGVLLGLAGEMVNLQLGEQTIAISWPDISKARLVE